MALSTWSMPLLQRTIFLVICLDTLVAGSSIRLYGDTSDDSGFVQVNVDGKWKTICNDDWDAVDASVSCRELGFNDGYSMVWREGSPPQSPHYDIYDYWSKVTTNAPLPTTLPPENFPTEGNNFACDGTEKSLLSCRYTTPYHNYCSQFAGVACGITAAKFKEFLDDIPDHYYYLYYSTLGNSSGRVVISHDHPDYDDYGSSPITFAGGICDMDERAANLICRQQGYSNGGKAIHVPTITNLAMMMSRLTCGDGSWQLEYCSRAYTTDGTCHDGVQYNGVECYTTLRPSVIGALAFAGVSCIFLIIAGAVGIHWIRRNKKQIPTSQSSTINLTVDEHGDARPTQSLQQSA